MLNTSGELREVDWVGIRRFTSDNIWKETAKYESRGDV
jgi:hypothetical protein